MVDYLIIACSGRALATSAKRAGYKVSVADFFTDEDTKLVSESAHQLPQFNNSFSEKELLLLIREVLAQHQDIKLVLGSGFESNPELLDELGKFAPVLSNTKESIIAVKDPNFFFSILKKNRISYPDFFLVRPDNSKNYLIKMNAGIGGVHINWAEKVSLESESDYYFQEFVSGQPYSVVFLADGNQASIVGFNQQLQTNEFSKMPFLYQGAVGLDQASIENVDLIYNIVNTISKEFNLKGLCGLDYILNEEGEVVVLEVNPRPPATFELHEEGEGLFSDHIACFDGNLPEHKTHNADIYKAYAILYAKQDSLISHDLEWPNWVKDKPTLGKIIPATFPICTVHAEEFSLDKVKVILFNRLRQIEMKIAATQNAA